MNVRRKSSTLNATGCFSTSYPYEKVCAANCAQATTRFLNAVNSMNRWNSPAKLNESLLEKAEKRGSIHYSQYGTSDIGVCLGVNDIKFRKKLLRLQRQQQEFEWAASSYLTSGIDRRKKGFVVNNMSDFEDEVSPNDRFEVKNQRQNIISKITHAISSLVGFIL